MEIVKLLFYDHDSVDFREVFNYNKSFRLEEPQQNKIYQFIIAICQGQDNNNNGKKIFRVFVWDMQGHLQKIIDI